MACFLGVVMGPSSSIAPAHPNEAAIEMGGEDDELKLKGKDEGQKDKG